MKKILSRYVQSVLFSMLIVSILVSLPKFMYLKEGLVLKSIVLFFINFSAVFLINVLLVYNKNIFIKKYYNAKKEGVKYNCFWYEIQATKKYAEYLSTKNWKVLSYSKKVELFLFAEENIFDITEITVALQHYFNLTMNETVSMFYNISRGNLTLRYEVQKRYIKSISIVEKVKLLKNIFIVEIKPEQLSDRKFLSDFLEKYDADFLRKCTEKTKKNKSIYSENLEF